MFRLSRGAEYAVRGMLHLAISDPEKGSYVEEIAEAQDVPKAYLAKIFQTLARKGFLRSTRGQGGGFKLLRSASDISLLDVIEAMEGPVFLNDCLIKVGYCKKDNTCPVHDVWQEAQEKLLNTLSGTNFKELAESASKKAGLLGEKRSKPEIAC
jgi:Rrf2 family protein